MGFINIRRVKRYNGLEVYGDSPKEPLRTRIGAVLKKGYETTATGIKSASAEVQKVRGSAGFKSAQDWLAGTNNYYQEGFDADKIHVSKQRRRYK